MENKLEKIVSLAKRRGFIYPGSEIYGGLAGTWDYGPLGVELKNNITDLWWERFVLQREDVYGIDAAIFMNAKVWEASGHIESFKEEMFRAGELYLRPETAQGMFVNFKNVVDSFHPGIPFGIAQIGKAFRDEISPRDFLFRAREFEQMEIEYFVKEKEWERYFEYWREEMMKWIEDIGLNKKHIHELEVSEKDRAHYSKRTIDFEYDFPFGKKELYGLAYRGDFDLKNHKLDYYDDGSKETFVPHVVEPTFGIDRTVLALLCDAYTEDEMGKEKRVFLKLKHTIAPIKAAVFPLVANKEKVVKKAKEVFQGLRETIPQIIFDDIGNIGKRYRRQDEIGTPWCVTIDYQTLEDNTVTIRDRDSGKQERHDISSLDKFL